MSVRTGTATLDEVASDQESGIGVTVRHGKILIVAIFRGELEWARECALDEADALADTIKQQVRVARGTEPS